MTLLVVPEGVRIEKGLVVEGAHQPHSQVYPLHVCTNGSMGGWWALPATFNLTLVYMLDAPQLNTKGLHVSSNISLSTDGAVEEVDSNACSVGTEASGSIGS